MIQLPPEHKKNEDNQYSTITMIDASMKRKCKQISK